MLTPILESTATEVVEGSVVFEEAAEGPLALLAGVTLEENAELMKEMTGLRWICRSLKDGRSPAEVGLVDRLEELEESLLVHFASEELEEFVGTLVTDHPNLLSRAASLEADHVELIFELDRLLGCTSGAMSPPDVAAKLLGFIARLDAHEHAETKLMQDLVCLEEGGGD